MWVLGQKLSSENSLTPNFAKQNLARPHLEFSSESILPSPETEALEQLSRLLHKTIKKITEDIEIFHFNTAISQLMILFNEMEKKEFLFENFVAFLKLLAPFAPHLTEEIWTNVLKNKKSIHLESWPVYDPGLIEDKTFELIIQVNGKVRDKVEAPIGISQKEAEELTFSREKVKNILGANQPRKVIFVPTRLINIVI